MKGYLSIHLQRRNVLTVTLPPPPPPKEPTFTCPVCMGPLVEEMSTRCGHIFCKKCIRAAIAAQSKCPTCRRKISMKNTIRVYLPTTNWVQGLCAPVIWSSGRLGVLHFLFNLSEGKEKFGKILFILEVLPNRNLRSFWSNVYWRLIEIQNHLNGFYMVYSICYLASILPLEHLSSRWVENIYYPFKYLFGSSCKYYSLNTCPPHAF